MPLLVRATRPQTATIEAACRGASGARSRVRPASHRPGAVPGRARPAAIAADGRRAGDADGTFRGPTARRSKASGRWTAAWPWAVDVAASVGARRRRGRDRSGRVYTVPADRLGGGRYHGTADGRRSGADHATLRSRAYHTSTCPPASRSSRCRCCPSRPVLPRSWRFPDAGGVVESDHAVLALVGLGVRSESPAITPGQPVWLRCETAIQHRLFGSYPSRRRSVWPWLRAGTRSVTRSATRWLDLSPYASIVNGAGTASLATEALWATTIRPTAGPGCRRCGRATRWSSTQPGRRVRCRQPVRGVGRADPSVGDSTPPLPAAVEKRRWSSGRSSKTGPASARPCCCSRRPTRVCLASVGHQPRGGLT